MKRLLAVVLASIMAVSSPMAVSAQEIIDVSAEAVEAESVEDEQAADTVPEEAAGAESLPEASASLSSHSAGIELNSAMIAEKKALSGVLTDLEKVVPGQDYIDGQLVVKVDNEAMAQKVAQGFEGELLSCQNGIAVVQTNLSTREAISLAADTGIQLPAVYPNYIYTLDNGKYAPLEKKTPTEIEADGAVKLEDILKDVEKETPDERHHFDESIQEAPASLNETVTGADEPADKPSDASVNDPDIEKQWFHKMIDTFTAWGTAAKKGEGVTVAVIDSGADASHPEFAGRITAIDMTSPYNGSEITSPYNGKGYTGSHGTHVAGIIGAAANNNFGGAGVAPKANILSLKVFEDGVKETSTYYIALAMLEALKNSDVRVINMSLGGPAGVADALLQLCIDEAVANGVAVVVSAGNEGWDISKSDYTTSPACLDGVITVASLDENGVLSNFSNYGQIAISAPGGAGSGLKIEGDYVYGVYDERDIYSTVPEGKFEYMAGTSQASPVVAGVVALMMSSADYAKTEDGLKQVVQDLKNSAIKAGNAKTYGAGRVNAAAAVKAISIYTKDNNFNVVAGKKLSLLAKTNNKSVKPQWTVSNAEVCSITAKGVLKAAKTLPENKKVDVVVTAAYDGKSTSATVTIWPGAASITKVTTDKTFNLKFHESKKFEVKASFGDETAPAPVMYKSSNNKVASVSANGVVNALANGKATITATTIGGKKTSVKVKVTDTPYYIERIVPVNAKDKKGQIMFEDSWWGEYFGSGAVPVSEGKTVKYKAIAMYPYSTSSDKKMTWNFETTGILEDGFIEDESGEKTFVTLSAKGVDKDKISLKNGALKIGKGLSAPILVEVSGCPQWIEDDKVKERETCFNYAFACKPIYSFHFGEGGIKTKLKTTTTVQVEKGKKEHVKILFYGKLGDKPDAWNWYPYVESSNDECATGFFDPLSGDIIVEGKAAGSCKLTVISMDGAYKKATINVTVK